MKNGFTPTEQRIIAVLADGQPHARKELMGCLDDELAEKTALKRHLTRLRKKLRPQGRDIMFVASSKLCGYRQVRYLDGVM